MQISKINATNYNSRIAFGESEVYEKSDCFPPRNGYELKKQQINQKFDLRRSSLCEIDSSPDVFWDQLRKNEILRKNALDNLEATCRKCKAKKWNFLKLFGLK